MKNNNLDAATLGKIVFARFLTLPLKAYDRSVEKIELSPHFRSLKPHVEVSALNSAVLCAQTVERSSSAPLALGEIRTSEGYPSFVYHRTAFVREYRFDEDEIERMKLAQGILPEIHSMLHRLRLINSRNRLTHALMHSLIDVQAEYLMSGNPLDLAAMPQARLTRILAERAQLPMVADVSRVSRLVRGLAFKMPDGKIQPLTTLLPNERQLHCHRIDHLMKLEKTLILERRIEHPLPDEAVASLLAQQYGVLITRRSVAAIRHHLAIPDWRRRAGRESYLSVAGGFSPLLPMTQQGVSAMIPSHSGVYEIHATSPCEDTVMPDSQLSTERTQVVYIGSTRNLRKRLSDHLRGNGSVLLFSALAEGGARVRYRVVSEDWRLLERQLYHAFCETFGAPPPCNRMSP